MLYYTNITDNEATYGQSDFYTFNIKSYVTYDSYIGTGYYDSLTIDTSVSTCSDGVYSISSSSIFTSCYYCPAGLIEISFDLC